MTKKLEAVWTVCVVLGCIGIIGMWVFGFKGQNTAAACSIVFAGVSSFVALVAKGLESLRRYNGAID